MSGEADLVGAVISVLSVSIIALVALAIFDPLAQMAPHSGKLGSATHSLTDAVSTAFPLAVGGTGLALVSISYLRATGG
jgi:hypothetical protein